MHSESIKVSYLDEDSLGRLQKSEPVPQLAAQASLRIGDIKDAFG